MPEEVRADLLLGRDTLSPGLIKASEAANKASGNIRQLTKELYEVGKQRATPVVDLNDAKATAKLNAVKARLDDLGRRAATATATVNDKDAAAKLAALTVKLDAVGKKIVSPRITLEGTDKAEAQLLALDVQLDHLSDKSAKAETATTGLAGLGGIPGGGMGALIAAGVALSPVIATLGVGLGGLAAAAVGVAKPIENAAQKTGGLRANLALLDPEQRKVAQGILSLGTQFGAFEKKLQPQVLGIFNQGLRIAGTLLKGVEPVAASTGRALDSVLGQVDAEFQSGTWQQFFGFMERTAGPDIQLLGKNFVDLTKALPPLVEQLQPVATDLLNITDASAKLIGWLARANQSLDGTGQHMNFLQHVTSTLRTVLFSPGAGLAAALKVLHITTTDAGNAAEKAAPQWSHASQAISALTTKTVAVAAPMDHLGKTSQTTSVTMTEVSSKAILISSSYDHLAKVADVVSNGQQTFAQKLAASAQAAKLDAAANATVAKELNVLAAAQEHALGPLENLIGANLTFANDLHTARVALRASGDAIGYKTQKERDSFATVQTVIQDAIKEGDAHLAAKRGIDGQIQSIQRALPFLESVRGKTQAYRDELNQLKGILDKLRAEKLIQEQVHVTGSGNWSLTRIGAGPLASKPLAAGGMIPGAGNSDNYPAMLTPGEVVVPKSMVRSGAVDHLRGSLPGFASGGLVPNYSGNVAGLPPWTSRNQQATISAIGVSIAQAMAAAFKAAVQAARAASAGAPGALGGPTSASAAQAQAYARSRLAAYGWGSSQMGPLIALWNQESGWSRFARNPTSGAYGIPQALPPSKMGAAANPPTSSAAAQINWGLGYIRGRYGSPAAAESHELAFHWYGNGGVIPEPVLGVGLRSGRGYGFGERGPEMVTPARSGAPQTIVLEIAPGGEGALTAAILQVIRKQIRIRGGGDVQLALGRL